jgi:hypothetical protein
VIIAWLVLSRRWDVFGNPEDGRPFAFVTSAALSAFEIASEIYWVGELLT